VALVNPTAHVHARAHPPADRTKVLGRNLHLNTRGSVLANVEVSFPPVSGGPAFASLQGQFGNSAVPPEPTVHDYSVVTNGKSCA
jgi:hypothetical protein